MSLIENKDKCTGCGACASSCPVNCISMKEDIGGFLYPVVNSSVCCNCNLCNTICPINSHIENNEPLLVLAFANSDNVRQKSTSGGFFSYISDWVLNNNGIIYGAIYSEEFEVLHIRAVDHTTRDKMCMSKYTQSKLKNVYNEVAEDLIDNRYVLFTGTPCQVSGLLSFLHFKKVNDDKLITCDFICHGVPSPNVWRDYLRYVEEKYHDNVISVNFRDKSISWHKPRLTIRMNKNVQSKAEATDPFYFLFYNGCVLRDSCYSCKYSNIRRVSDITMGDCWGIELSHPELDDDKGLSLILINTKKGLSFVNQHQERDCSCIPISLEDIRQPHLSHPAAKSRRYQRFWKDYENKSFRYILDVYGNNSNISKMINKIKGYLAKMLRIGK